MNAASSSEANRETPAAIPKTHNQGRRPPRADTSDFSVIFVHSLLDDYGLRPPEFRVYCHMARRAGRGQAWPKVAEIARVCRLHPQTVRKALHTLTAHQLLRREPRPGTTTLYRLTAASAWRPATRIDDNAETDRPLSGSPVKKTQGQPYETNTVKGNPLEGYPQKEIQNPLSPPKGESVNNASVSLCHAEEIYEAYPRKVGKHAALRAIQRALAKRTFDFLLERTRLFGTTYEGEARFIPHPAKWFNEERFNDDPVTWRRTTTTNGKATPSRQFHREDYKQPITNF